VTPRREQAELGLVLLIYVTLACGYAWYTPPWNNPDEPAHYNYIAFVAERQALPELAPGDWDVSLLNAAIPERFHPRFDVSGLGYESHQPPLYYLISMPVYSVTSSASLRARVLALRGVSIALGVLLGVAVYRLAREIGPRVVGVGPLATAMALLIPMSTAAAASINNDMLAMTLATVTVLLLIRWTRWLPERAAQSDTGPSTREAIMLGLLVGLLLLTKLTVYVMAALSLGVVTVVAMRQQDQTIRRLHIRRLAVVTLVAAVIAGWWFVRGGLVYGWGDVLAQGRHDAVVTGQPRYADFGPANWFYFLVTTFHSFFAQFGWMTIVVDDFTYWMFAIFGSLALAGMWVRRSELQSPRLSVLLVAIVLVICQLLYYNLSFVQAQGRYLFPAIGPIAVLLALGWLTLARDGLVATSAATAWNYTAIVTAMSVIATGEGNVALVALAVVVFVVFQPAIMVRIAGTERMAKWKAPTDRDASSQTPTALTLLNWMCLAHYVLPFYRG
jgi:hypothetical protein